MTKKKNKKLINVLQFAGFGFPALFIWMSVVIIPFIYGIWITFTDWNGLAMHINYVGLQNYIDVFKDATFVSSFVKTVIYAFFTVLASNIVGFALALAVTSGIKGQGLFRTRFLHPEYHWWNYTWIYLELYILLCINSSWKEYGCRMDVYILADTSYKGIDRINYRKFLADEWLSYGNLYCRFNQCSKRADRGSTCRRCNRMADDYESKIAINPQYDSNLYFLIYFKNLYVI